MHKITLIFLLVSLSINAAAQLQKKYIEDGKKHLNDRNPVAAIKSLNNAMQIDSNNAELLNSLGDAYRLDNNYRKALFYYAKCQKMDSKKEFTFSSFYAAEMCKYLGLYSKSTKYYKRFSKRWKGSRQDYAYLKATNEIENYNALLHLVKKNNQSISISNEHASNTDFSEFSGFILNDSTLLFSSLRSDSLKKKKVLDSIYYFSRIYQSKWKDNWEIGKKRPEFHEDEKVHIANASSDPRGEYIYYTECSGGRCEIFRVKIVDGSWQDFERLPDKINMNGTTSTQPTLARIDGLDYLFFASDRRGGQGMMDIWYTVAYSNGLFDDPVNLGSEINSAGNEICPFYLEQEQMLYFSSDFYLGIGGFDIFRSKGVPGEFASIENPGGPLNTSYNDLYFRFSSSISCLTSNRDGALSGQFQNCCNDLFFFEYEPSIVKQESELSEIEKLEDLLPLQLFFDNDQPEPNSKDTSTTVNYSATYVLYNGKKDKYKREFSRGLKGEMKEEAQEEMESFFQSYLNLGFEDLETALELLKDELEKGKKVELIIKGYASRLSESEYNKNLTLRRIHSVKNELMHYNNGVFSDYFKSGQLRIKSLPYGEERSSESISNYLTDTRNTVYSPNACFERRVEIIGVREF